MARNHTHPCYPRDLVPSLRVGMRDPGLVGARGRVVPSHSTRDTADGGCGHGQGGHGGWSLDDEEDTDNLEDLGQ
jgi:hypothetical protein